MSLSRIDSNAIAANAISAADLADNSVTSNKISGEVPVSKGGTGSASLTANAVLLGNGTSAVATVSAGTSGNVLTSDGSRWVSQAIVTTSNTVINAYTSNTTWTKPANLKSIKVIVIGGGGGGSEGVAGGNGLSSSFGTFCSATGGIGGGIGPATPDAGPGGVGSGGDINLTGEMGSPGGSFNGGSTFLGTGASRRRIAVSPFNQQATFGGGGYGPTSQGGGGGTAIKVIPAPSIPGPVTVTVGLGGVGTPSPGSPGSTSPGANGIVVVEEFY